jgi:glyoxylase-like metal-dependent hydrolase (beta-lactamase superfamily II)
MVAADIHVLDRGRLRMDANFRAEGAVVATAAEPNPDLAFEAIPVYNLLIEHPEATILVDTGSHHDAADGHWPPELYAAFPHEDAAERRLDDCLAEVGFGVADVDCVVQTHLHLDHAGGLEFFGGTDTPIYVHEAELPHAYYAAKTDEAGDGYLAADFDHDLNWTVVHGERTQYFEDVEFLHLPGHTPGQMGLVVEHDDAGTLAFASDHLETARNYREEVPPGPGLLWGRTEWFESLWKLKDLVRRRDATVIYGHDSDQFAAIRDGW